MQKSKSTLVTAKKYALLVAALEKEGSGILYPIQTAFRGQSIVMSIFQQQEECVVP